MQVICGTSHQHLFWGHVPLLNYRLGESALGKRSAGLLYGDQAFTQQVPGGG